MTEVVFAKTFLSTLDSKPTKISADHVEDPRSYPARPPYILPRLSNTFSPPTSKSTSAPLPGSEPSLTVLLKSLRNPPLDIRLTSQPPSTSVLDIKREVSEKTALPVDKMRLLVRKKPVADSKILKELVGDGDKEVEFSVMVLGGAAALPAAAGKTDEKEKHKHVAQGLSGRDVLQTEEFWTDLGGFLQQRIRDETAAEELVGVFRGAWNGMS